MAAFLMKSRLDGDIINKILIVLPMSARYCGLSIVRSLAGEGKGIKKSLRSSRYRKEELSFFVSPLKEIAKSQNLKGIVRPPNHFFKSTITFAFFCSVEEIKTS